DVSKRRLCSGTAIYCVRSHRQRMDAGRWRPDVASRSRMRCGADVNLFHEGIRMKSNKKRVQENVMPPGKEKAPKPQPAADLTKSVSNEVSDKPNEQKAQDQVIAPDGEPRPKKEPEPLF